MRIPLWIQTYWRHMAAALTMVGLVFLVYHPLLSVGFFSDDYDFLMSAHNETNPWSVFVKNTVGTRQGASYGPFFSILIYLQYHVFGLNGVAFHLVTFLFCALTGYGLCLFVRALTHQWALGLVSGALFVTMQSHTSSLAWIAVQTHVIPTALAVFSMYAYYLFVRDGARRYYFAAIITLTIALFTKEIVITVPLVFVLFELLLREPPVTWWSRVRQICVRLLPLVVIWGIYLSLRYVITQTGLGYYGQSHLMINMRQWVGMFVEMTGNLFMSYPARQQVRVWVLARPLMLWALVVVSIALTVHHRFYRREAVCFLIAYVVLSLPFLPLMYNALHDGGERYTYFVSTVASMYSILLLYRVFGRSRHGLFVSVSAGLLLCILGVVVQQPKIALWQKSHQIVDTAIRTYQEEPLPPNSYAIFIGLPDTIDGAEVFRNGVQEMLFLHTGQRLDGERIFMNTVVPVSYVGDHLVRLVESGDQAYRLDSALETNHRAFTGFPHIEQSLGTFTLGDFRIVDHTGTHIDMVFDQSALDVLRQDGYVPYVVYFNEQRFVSAPL